MKINSRSLRDKIRGNNPDEIAEAASHVVNNEIASSAKGETRNDLAASSGDG